jgi:hypothetical protein
MTVFPASTVFAPAIKPWSVAPEDHGAKGDGTTNDTVALQAAFAEAKSGRRKVVLNGSYNIPSASFVVDSRMLIEGSGELVRSTDVLFPLIEVKAGADDTIIDGIQARYTPATTGASGNHGGIVVRNASRVTLRGVRTLGPFYVGLSFENAPDGLVEGCSVRGFFNRGIYGYLASGGMRIIGNLVDGADTSGTIVGTYGVNINDGGITTPARYAVTGNTIRNATAHGLGIGGTCRHLTATGNNISSTGVIGNGVAVIKANGNRPREILLNDNTIEGFDTGMLIGEADGVIVSNNLLMPASTAVLVTDSKGVIVKGNISKGGANNHFWALANSALSCQDLTFTDNMAIGGLPWVLVTTANCDRITHGGNRRVGGAGSYSIGGTNIITGAANA